MTVALQLPRSIYSRTMLLVGLVTFLLQVTTFMIFFNQMVLPNVHTQVELFVDEMQAFALQGEQIQPLRKEDFVYLQEELLLQPASWRIPFWHFVEQELEARSGSEITLWEELESPVGGGHYWVDIPFPEQGRSVRVGFPAQREGCLNPPVLLLVLFLVVSTSVISVYFLSRWLVKPIEELRMAVGEMGMGEYPHPLPEKGPAEFSSLVHRFNWMVKSVQSLTENRSTLLAGVSHDLKTPLARMRLSVELLSAKQDPDLVEGIVEDIDVMDGMISEVLEFAKGERQGKRERFDIQELIEGVVERKRRGGVNVEWTPLEESCVRELDHSALRRILSNFIDNGHRYGEGAPLEVRLQCSEARVVIEVHDQGEGIPEEALEKVFRPFYRLERSRSQDSGGSGLGLAIVKSLANANGWWVSLYNRPAGGVVARVEISG